MIRLLLVVPILAIAGCFGVDRKEDTSARTVRTYREEGTQGGVAYAKYGQEETSNDSHATSNSTLGVDPNLQRLLMSAGTAASTGNYGPLAGVAFSTAAAAAAAWLRERSSSKEHKADADDAWERLAAVKGKPNV